MMELYTASPISTPIRLYSLRMRNIEVVLSEHAEKFRLYSLRMRKIQVVLSAQAQNLCCTLCAVCMCNIQVVLSAQAHN